MYCIYTESSTTRWAAAGARNALEPIACAAFLYGYTLDLESAKDVAEAAARLSHFAVPATTLDELPLKMPMLLVQAGRDENPRLNRTLQRFADAQHTRSAVVTMIDHAEAPHAFDLLDDTEITHEVIQKVLKFLSDSLLEVT